MIKINTLKKRVITLLMCAVLMFTCVLFAACGKDSGETSTNTPAPAPSTPTTPTTPTDNEITLYVSDGSTCGWLFDNTVDIDNTSFDGNEVWAIKSEGVWFGYNPGATSDNDQYPEDLSGYTTDEYTFTIKFDLYLNEEVLTGTNNPAVGPTGVFTLCAGFTTNWDSLQVSFGNRDAEGNVKVDTRFNSHFAGNDTVKENTWYTVTYQLSKNEEGKVEIKCTITGDGVNLVYEYEHQTKVGAETPCFNVYHAVADEICAYMDNISVVATKK